VAFSAVSASVMHHMKKFEYCISTYTSLFLHLHFSIFEVALVSLVPVLVPMQVPGIDDSTI
jgi:hypothetical protein